MLPVIRRLSEASYGEKPLSILELGCVLGLGSSRSCFTT